MELRMIVLFVTLRFSKTYGGAQEDCELSKGHYLKKKNTNSPYLEYNFLYVFNTY
jgi:hypothetical protein